MERSQKLTQHDLVDYEEYCMLRKKMETYYEYSYRYTGRAVRYESCNTLKNIIFLEKDGFITDVKIENEV